VRISGSNAGYTMFRGRVKSTGYPLHSPVSHSLPLPCVTVCHQVSTGLYQAHNEQFSSETTCNFELRNCLFTKNQIKNATPILMVVIVSSHADNSHIT
jgi:hypothetical protein